MSACAFPLLFHRAFSPQQSVHERYADSHQRNRGRILGDQSWVGHYEVTAKKDSFKIFRVPDAEPTVDQALTVNMKLEAGSAVTEEVHVHADAAPDVDLETSQASNIVDARKIQGLPLILRDPIN